MDLQVTDEQQAIAEAVRELVAEKIRGAHSTASIWHELQQLGLAEAFLPENQGGAGLGLCDLLLVFRELGAVAYLWPWAQTLVSGAVVRAATAGDGAATTVVVLRPHTVVRVPQGCEHVALIDGATAHVVNAEELGASDRIDYGGGTDWRVIGDADLSGATSLDVGEQVLDAGRVAQAALMLGAAEYALELSVKYTSQREQFGRAIGSFQAVKHLLAQARVELAIAEPLVIGAAVAVDTAVPSAARDAAVALLMARQCAMNVIRTAIQVHGGMGYTSELELGALLASAVHALEPWSPPAGLGAMVDQALLQGEFGFGSADPGPWA